MESLSANTIKWSCGRNAWKGHTILSRVIEDYIPITAKVRGNQAGRSGPEFSVGLLLLRSRHSAFDEAPMGVGYRGHRMLKLRGMLQVYVAGPRVPGDKARAT